MRDLLDEEYSCGDPILDEVHMHIIGILREITGLRRVLLDQRITIVTKVDQNEGFNILTLAPKHCSPVVLVTHARLNCTLSISQYGSDEQDEPHLYPISVHPVANRQSTTRAARDVVGVFVTSCIEAYEAVTEAYREGENEERRAVVKGV